MKGTEITNIEQGMSDVEGMVFLASFVFHFIIHNSLFDIRYSFFA